MEVGELVKKTTGARAGQVGTILTIENNPVGNTFLEVLLLDGTVVVWWAELVEPLNLL